MGWREASYQVITEVWAEDGGSYLKMLKTDTETRDTLKTREGGNVATTRR